MRFFLVTLMIFLLGRDAFAAQTRTALIIGNGQYTHISKLRNTINDANDMAKTLKKKGFDVILRLNASQREMNKAITLFGKTLKRKGGVGLLYYSGHGVQVGGVNYMLPVEVEVGSPEDLKYEAVHVSRALDAMDSANNGLNIIILDACRNSPFKSRSTGGEGLARMKAPRGSIVAYSTEPGATASDGRGRNGLYTAELLKALNIPNIPVERVFKETLKRVVESSRGKQIPWVSTSFIGDFYFVGGPKKEQEFVAPDISMWNIVKNSDSPEDYNFFIKTYPSSLYTPTAKLKRNILLRDETSASPVSGIEPVQLYAQGQGFIKSGNKEKGARLILRAAEQGYAPAQNHVGNFFNKGEIFDENKAEAFRWYKKAAEQGYAYSIYGIAIFYERGEGGVKKSIEKAIDWLIIGAKKNDAWSQYLLGKYYFSGIGLERNFTKAAYWYKKAASQNLRIAQFRLGDLYYFGRGVPKSAAEANKWYKKSAKQGYRKAQYFIGVAYDTGDGVQKDFGQALKWYQKAANAGHEKALFNLGKMYEYGDGVQKNMSKAVALYEKSARKGFPRALFNMGIFYEQGKYVRQDFSKSVENYLAAYKKGHSPSAYNIGVLYYNKVLPGGNSKAFRWMQKAADLGDQDAQDFLKRKRPNPHEVKDGVGDSLN